MRSDAIMTRLCSQRSTNVPAIGPRKMFGSVAARKTRPVASGESGHAENEDAQRDLVQPVAEEADRLREPVRGKSWIQRQAHVRVAADLGAQAEGAGQAGARARAQEDRPLQANPRCRGSVRAATQADAGRLRVVPAAHERGEDEPAQAGRDEGVADARDVAHVGKRDRDEVRDRAAHQEELKVRLDWQEHMEADRQVACAHAGGRKRRPVDGHEAAVDDDCQPIGRGANDHGRDAREVAVGPQAGE